MVALAVMIIVIKSIPLLEYKRSEKATFLIVVLLFYVLSSNLMVNLLTKYSAPLAGIFQLLGHFLPVVYLYLRYKNIALFGFRIPSTRLWLFILATLTFCFGTALLARSGISLLVDPGNLILPRFHPLPIYSEKGSRLSYSCFMPYLLFSLHL